LQSSAARHHGGNTYTRLYDTYHGRVDRVMRSSERVTLRGQRFSFDARTARARAGVDPSSGEGSRPRPADPHRLTDSRHPGVRVAFVVHALTGRLAERTRTSTPSTVPDTFTSL
jgi:hypothetical protein